MEFLSGFLSCKMPLYSGSNTITSLHPGCRFPTHTLHLSQTAVETLPSQDGKPYLCHIQPAAIWSASLPPPRRRHDKSCWRMGAQVVQNHPSFFIHRGIAKYNLPLYVSLYQLHIKVGGMNLLDSFRYVMEVILSEETSHSTNILGK